MSENDNTSSGSRWEPAAQQPGSDPAWQPPTVPQQPAGTTSEAAVPTATAPRGKRGRVALAAAAVGLVAAGGVGGFVVGQASSGNASETGVVQNGVPGQGGTEGGFPGGGTRPDFGGDRDGDHGVPPGAGDDGGQAAPDGSQTAPDGSAGDGTT